MNPAALDKADPLSGFRERFDIPGGIIYLDGNSLGPLPRSTAVRMARTVAEEWGQGLITSWNKAGWIDWPRRIAARLAPIVGAEDDELLIGDSTSINLMKLTLGALAARPDRRVILTEEGNFPTDLYGAAGAAELAGAELRAVPRGRLLDSLTPDVAVLSLTHVDYCSGHRYDMAALTRAAHEAGALALWDLSHSAGVLELDLGGCGADLAVGCGYKYLNGGPGAPSFLFVKRELQDILSNPLPGWMGHAAPFEFSGEYRPAPGIAKFLTGTPAILSLAALDEGLTVLEGVDMAMLEAKAGALGDLFAAIVEEGTAELALASPREAPSRGGHVAFAHEHAYAIVQALIERGVIGDFRAPNLARFGFSPLTLTFSEVAKAAETLVAVMREGGWRDPRFGLRSAVT